MNTVPIHVRDLSIWILVVTAAEKETMNQSTMELKRQMCIAVSQ